MTEDRPTVEVDIGQPVYSEDGEKLGVIRGFDEAGFIVTAVEAIEPVTVERELSMRTYGEAELLWRCGSCGEVGDIDAVPDECPSCGGPREGLYYWIED